MPCSGRRGYRASEVEVGLLGLPRQNIEPSSLQEKLHVDLTGRGSRGKRHRGKAESPETHYRVREHTGGRDLVNPTRARPPQTTRRAHRVAVQLQGAHRRPYWELQEVRFLVHLMEILCKLGSQPGNLLLHDGHTRPDLVDPPGLAGDMAGGGPEAVLQQEIPVI